MKVEVDEKARVRSAILVDFILSVEIIILALSTTVEATLIVQIITVSIIALLATVGVYGLVGLIVRMDDAGLVLMRSNQGGIRQLGSLMVQGLPVLVRIIGAIGTAALILVAGGIFHHIEAVHDLFHSWPGLLVDGLLGLVVGGLALLIVSGMKRFS